MVASSWIQLGSGWVGCRDNGCLNAWKLVENKVLSPVGVILNDVDYFTCEVMFCKVFFPLNL
jgi:hypothetical protein